VIFGPDDSFFNRFARCSGSPARFRSPAQGALRAGLRRRRRRGVRARARRPGTFDQRYDLCGPRVFTLRELVDYTVEAMGERKPIWS